MGCVDSKSGIETEEHKCNILTKMDTIRPCNTQQCATWQTSMWSQVSCICRYLHLFSNSQRVIHLTNCSNLINILYVRLISTFQCSATCGEAVQVREVVCSENSDCDPDQKPPTLQPCLLPKCLAWKHGPWNTVSILSAFVREIY